jgi:hypothetical protein
MANPNGPPARGYGPHDMKQQQQQQYQNQTPIGKTSIIFFNGGLVEEAR